MQKIKKLFKKNPAPETNTIKIPLPTKTNNKHLIVDDSKINREVMIKRMDRIGIQCDEAVNGQITLHMVNVENPYTIIWMDIQMPILDGIECTKQLRNSGYNGFIIGLTGHVDEDTVNRCKKAGMNHVLAKPVDKEDIICYSEKYSKKLDTPKQ